MKLLLFLALLPAVLLIIYIYCKDKVEKEPLSLLSLLFILGGLTTIPAAISELAFGELNKLFFTEGSVTFMLIEDFLIVALSEEAGKFLVMKLLTWRSRHFNFTFDAVVYAVVASLGFAAFENVVYVLSGNVGTAIMRGLLAVPGHAIDGVFMGCYYGIARKCKALGDENGAKRNLFKSLAVPVITHGFYDFCLDVSSTSGIFLLVFFAFEIIVTVAAVKKVNKLSRTDESLTPAYLTDEQIPTDDQIRM